MNVDIAPSPNFYPAVVPPLPILIAVVAVITVTIACMAIFDTRWFRQVRSKMTRRLSSAAYHLSRMSMAFIVVAVLVGGTSIIAGIVQHQSAVETWANDVYNLDLNRPSVVALLDGQERVAERDGIPVRIEFVQTIEGGIAVYEVTSGQPLQPAG